MAIVKIKSVELGDLYLKAVMFTDMYQLTKLFTATVKYIDENKEEQEIKISVPAKFTTNFATIGRWFWWFIAPDDPIIREASVVHDYLYDVLSDKYNISRKESDLILKEVMRILNASLLKRNVAYSYVRLLGFIRYKK